MASEIRSKCSGRWGVDFELYPTAMDLLDEILLLDELHGDVRELDTSVFETGKIDL